MLFSIHKLQSFHKSTSNLFYFIHISRIQYYRLLAQENQEPHCIFDGSLNCLLYQSKTSLMTSWMYSIILVLMLTALHSYLVLALPHHRHILVLSKTSPGPTPTPAFAAINPTQYPPTTTIKYSEPGTKGVS